MNSGWNIQAALFSDITIGHQNSSIYSSTKQTSFVQSFRVVIQFHFEGDNNILVK